MGFDLQNFFRVIFWLCFKQLLQDVAAGMNPVPQKAAISVPDANLMFEFLLGGVAMDQDNNIVMLDEEMASMRQGRAFLSQINDSIPRSLSSMVQMVSAMEDEMKRRPLTPGQFETLGLSLVFSAHQASQQKKKEEREAWGEVLFQLANIIVHQLRGSHLFNYA